MHCEGLLCHGVGVELHVQKALLAGWRRFHREVTSVVWKGAASAVSGPSRFARGVGGIAGRSCPEALMLLASACRVQMSAFRQQDRRAPDMLCAVVALVALSFEPAGSLMRSLTTAS